MWDLQKMTRKETHLKKKKFFMHFLFPCGPPNLRFLGPLDDLFIQLDSYSAHGPFIAPSAFTMFLIFS